MTGEWRGDEWGRLNPYLFRSTFLALGGSTRPNCSLCLESDHRDDYCALAKTKAAMVPPTRQSLTRDPYRQSYQDSAQRLSRGKVPKSTICFLWNQGIKGNVRTLTASSGMHVCDVEAITVSSIVVLWPLGPLQLIESR